MKKFFSYAMMVLALAAVSPVLTSCGEDDEKEEVFQGDLTALTELQEEAKALLASATADDYPQNAIDEFKTTVASIEAAAATVKSQNAVDALAIQLTEAIAKFKASAYGFIDEKLVAISVDPDCDVIGGKATLCEGPASVFAQTAKPTVVDGNKAGSKAYHFAAGSHVDVEVADYKSIMGAQLTISAWVNPDETYENNYIISLNKWNSWKFQLQSQNKPFFTCHTDADGWCDADNEADFSAENNKWSHQVAVLDLKAQTLCLYTNGELMKEWTIEGKPGLHGNGIMVNDPMWDLVIGAACPNSQIGENDTETSHGYFKGSIDNLKVYSAALTAGQVKKLYKDEK